MESYDPLQAPNPKTWLALDEGDRIALIETYHENAGIDLPAMHLHASLHCVIETQAAEGSQLPTAKTLKRLQREGLHRHDAIHACADVLFEHMQALMDNPPPGDPNTPYFHNLKKLKAQTWLDSFKD